MPNDFTLDWIEGHFLDVVARAAAGDTATTGASVTFAVSERPLARPTAPERPAEPAPQQQAQATAQREAGDVELNPKYTFDLFVIGSSNRFAHAAALAVAEAPAQAYNPLFIYGGTGLGKTHLLQAIGHYVRQHSRRLTARYVTSETFMNEFIDAVRERGTRIEGFKRRYRNYDVLLVDDIQFIEGKERIQEEFFHTFNSLYEGGAQIIISSDRPPREIATLEERLRSRFEWGLLTDIQAPDLETRIAILRKRVETEGIAITDPEVLTFIASRVSANIRELEGALTRVVAFSSLTDRPLTVELAENVLKDVYPQGEAAPEVTIARIQETVSQRFGVTHDELVEPAALAGRRVSAAGRDVPLTRAHRCVAPDDRQGVRGPRSHDGDPCEGQDHEAHSRGPLCVQPCARVDRAHQAGTLMLGVQRSSCRVPVGNRTSVPTCFNSRFPCSRARIRPSSPQLTLL